MMTLKNIKDYLCAGNPVWDVDEVAKVMDEAIAAVEKQTPKKPNGKYAYKPGYRRQLIEEGECEEADKLDYYCPSCGGYVDTFLDGDVYCKNCGQKMDWSK